MLDLSAAFDTVDHKTQKDRFHYRFGIRGEGIAWLGSAYLLERLKSKFSTLITNVLLTARNHVVYDMYTTSLTKVIKQHNVLVYNFNADDA